jgi:hypothetical protein
MPQSARLRASEIFPKNGLVYSFNRLSYGHRRNGFLPNLKILLTPSLHLDVHLNLGNEDGPQPRRTALRP